MSLLIVKTLRSGILLTLFLVAGFVPSAFAAGGTCPAGANYNNGTSTTLFTLSSLGVTSCFYASSSGVDTNTGTDEAHPWLHLPGMSGCSGVCASTTPATGQGFILQGGSTYHFSGRGTPVGLPWSWSWGGTSSNPVYVGVDHAWFSGSSWTRPVITGDNPTSTSAVSSCAHADDNENWMNISSSASHVIVDFIEAVGMCWNTGNGLTIFNAGSSNFNTWTNDYIHGWTRQSSCNSSGCAEGPTGFASNNGSDAGSGNPGWGNVYSQVVVDGFDSSNDAFTAMEWQCYNLNNSVFNRYTNIVCAHHLAYGNIFSNTRQNQYAGDHGNVFEENGSVQNAGPNGWFNNLVSNNGNGVTVWLNPQVGSTDYVFNNVFWGNTNSGNTYDVGDNNGNIGAQIIFNSTYENPENASAIICQPTSHSYSVTIANVHFITDGSSGTNCSGTSTNLVMSHSTAASQGYKASGNFFYSPTLATNSTVGAGANETAKYCAALTSGGNTVAGAACQADTTYACTYNTSTHTVSCPARMPNPRSASGNWDIGAYLFGNPSAPNPPTNLKGVVQ